MHIYNHSLPTFIEFWLLQGHLLSYDEEWRWFKGLWKLLKLFILSRKHFLWAHHIYRHIQVFSTCVFSVSLYTWYVSRFDLGEEIYCLRILTTNETENNLLRFTIIQTLVEWYDGINILKQLFWNGQIWWLWDMHTAIYIHSFIGERTVGDINEIYSCLLLSMRLLYPERWLNKFLLLLLRKTIEI